MIERVLVQDCISAGAAPAVPRAAHAHLATTSDVALRVDVGVEFVGLLAGPTAAVCEPGGR